METPNSPLKCRVFTKEELTFHNNQGNIQGQALPPSPPTKCERKSGEWQLQPGLSSALLTKQEEETSKIYASNEVNLTAHAWQVRVTTACSKLFMSVGSAARSDISSDLDEEFVCDFDLSKILNFENYNADVYKEERHQRRNSKSERKPSYRHRRKRSTFERSSVNFFIVLDRAQELMTVISMATGEEKTLKIDRRLKNLRPFVGMLHYCGNENCPRPIVSFV